MKKLPLGIQTFSKIIEGNYIYVDKTEEIFSLISSPETYYFISRPRRFGKSLLISTLKEIFLGNKELFKDLWIYDKIEWKKHPVIHIDFSGISYETPQDLKRSLSHRILKLGEEYKIKLDENLSYKDNFKELLEKLSEKEKVVILIDEYDKPLVEFIDKPEIALENRGILKNFYEVIKESDQYLRFVMLTGVSKFSKISVFSGLNNLHDITLAEKYSTLLGYTSEELEKYFSEYISKMAEKLKYDVEFLSYHIKKWYNGYSWDGENFVYNPFSILYLFIEQKISNYWFTSGTPTFLVKMIKKYNTNIIELENFESDESLFDAFDIDKMNVQSLLFQTGYLTIKKITDSAPGVRDYLFSYPNIEVKESLLKHLLADLSENINDTGVIINKLVKNLNKNDIESFFEQLKSLFSSIPYDIFIKDREAYYHTIIYLALTLMGVRIKVEVHTNKGRIDGVIETDNHIYVLEFKLGTADKALEQIESMKYHQKYISSGKPVTLIGIGFDVEQKNVGNYLIKEV